MSDLSVVNCGSVFLVRSTSPTGQEWLAEHIPEDAQWFGGAVAVEHHDVGNIVQGAIDGGLSIGGGRAMSVNLVSIALAIATLVVLYALGTWAQKVLCVAYAFSVCV
jgi:hypothetical protein